MSKKLNDLNGKEWVKSTKSWFILDGKTRGKDVIKHPGKFPEELAEKLILFFSKKGDVVLDMFSGTGSTGVACDRTDREYFGIEISDDFNNIARERIHNGVVISGDSRKKETYESLGEIDFILTSPPYWNMLNKKRGNSKSQHSERKKKGLQLNYTDSENDLGNINDYNRFLEELQKVFTHAYKKLKNKKYMVVVLQNFRDKDRGYTTLAWDIVPYIEKIGFSFEGEQLWLQDNKMLGIWGYPTTFVSNIHHHYCLVFRKNEK